MLRARRDHFAVSRPRPCLTTWPPPAGRNMTCAEKESGPGQKRTIRPAALLPQRARNANLPRPSPAFGPCLSHVFVIGPIRMTSPWLPHSFRTGEKAAGTGRSSRHPNHGGTDASRDPPAPSFGQGVAVFDLLLLLLLRGL
ncbi:hypothetical protein CDD83_11093 [Cordyceps sp. RAO-2017]|nr:hypothetical protein CDD83_11093 [Cordyceps sp. RAO-2017]